MRKDARNGYGQRSAEKFSFHKENDHPPLASVNPDDFGHANDLYCDPDLLYLVRKCRAETWVCSMMWAIWLFLLVAILTPFTGGS